MNEKLRLLREYIGLNETEFSKITNINSYKYKRFEAGTLPISTECIIIISIAYNLSIDEMIFEKHSIEKILHLEQIEELRQIDKSQIIDTLKRNICKHSSYYCNEPNYRTIRNILNIKRNACSYNLKKIRYNLAMDVDDFSFKINNARRSLFFDPTRLFLLHRYTH